MARYGGTQATTRQKERDADLRRRGRQLLNRLIEAGMGEVEMQSEQIAAARIALSKILPDLKAVEHSGETSLHVTGIEITVIK